ncbi:MAG TPA: hypothetical protein VLD16_14895 [Gaiellaceae bacterium]|nr:hypothetical protein [Gaiellaceae bacterium]
MKRLLLTAAGLAALAASIPLVLAGRSALTPSAGGSPLDTVASAYATAAAAPAQAPADLPLRLARLSGGIRSPRERAQADVLVGATFALPAGNGSVGFDVVRRLGGGRLLDQAAGAFRSAALLDAGNEAAKYDLELLLKAQTATPAGQRRRSGRSSNPTSQRQQQRSLRKPARGSREEHAAGTSSPGSGY